MAEIPQQENFEDKLFAPPAEPAPEREHVKCPYCEDAGICTFCDRGRELAANLPASEGASALFKRLRAQDKKNRRKKKSPG